MVICFERFKISKCYVYFARAKFSLGFATKKSIYKTVTEKCSKEVKSNNFCYRKVVRKRGVDQARATTIVIAKMDAR